VAHELFFLALLKSTRHVGFGARPAFHRHAPFLKKARDGRKLFTGVGDGGEEWDENGWMDSGTGDYLALVATMLKQRMDSGTGGYLALVASNYAEARAHVGPPIRVG